MFSFLHNHPFAVEAFFKNSLVITLAVPKNELGKMIPECLSLDAHDNYAFLAVALVQTKKLRPKGFPEMTGRNFFLIGYRIFVRYNSNNGKNLRGLYILRSETDKKPMSFYGNIFTRYNYSTTDIELISDENGIEVNSKTSKLKICVNRQENPALPDGSPFKDWKEARRFAGPLPFTFSYDGNKKEVTIIEGVRENWTPQPVELINFQSGFINDLKLNFIPANAFVVENIPYYWKKGRTEKWRREDHSKV